MSGYDIDDITQSENARLRVEVARLNREREIVQNEQRLLTCVFCGQEYPPGTPTQNHQALTDHVAICEKHPAARFRLERDEALKEVERLKAKYEPGT